MNFKRLWLLTAFVVMTFGALTAKALTPADTRLTNTATLTFNGGSTVTDTVTVIVALVPAAVVILTAPADQSAAEASALSVTYRVYAQANGEDEYFITASESTEFQIEAASITSYVGDPTSLFLGASAILNVVNATTFTIPGDNDADGVANVVAGLAAGEDVYIAGILYRIDSISETATLATIVLEATDIDPLTPAATDLVVAGLTLGEGVFESITYDIETTDVGNIDTGFVTGTYNVDTQITNGADNATDTFVVTLVKTNIDKYVRCLTLCTESGVAVISYDGTTTEGAAGAGGGLNDFYDAGTTPEPNGTVEYLIRMENNGAVALTTTNLADTLPDFSSYVAESLRMNGVAGATDSGVFPLTAGLDVGAVPGTIAASEIVYVTYTVLIAP